MLFCNAALSVHASHPYSTTTRAIVVRSLYFVLMEMLALRQVLLRFIKDDVAIANRVRTSEHFPSAVASVPKYTLSSSTKTTVFQR